MVATIFNEILWTLGLLVVVFLVFVTIYMIWEFIRECFYKAREYKRCIHRISQLLEENTSSEYKVYQIKDTIELYGVQKKEKK